MADKKKKGLVEGFASTVGKTVRSYFAKTPQSAAAELRRGGVPSVERAGLPYNLTSQFGYDNLSEHLRVDQDLQARYADYEEMDEYPEITCLAGRSMVYTIEWGWKRIDELSDVGGGFMVLSYDFEKSSIVTSRVEKAWMSGEEGHGKPMVRVSISNGEEIDCTFDHPFLGKDGHWVEAKMLRTGHELMLNHSVIGVDPIPSEPVFDLNIPGFHNFMCNGVVVHNTALDIYADDSTAPQMDKGDVSIWATCESKEIQKDLNEVLHRRLLVGDDVWGVTRTLAKYGNVYGELLVAEPGLVGIQYVPPPTVRRVEDPRGSLLGFIQDVRGEFNVSMEDFYALARQRNTGEYAGRAPGELTVFEDWEIIHWRLRGKHLRSVYGHGVIDPARWIWKRLSMLEDALLIYKLERSPSRYAFYVDVGQLDAERGLAHVNRVKNSFTRKSFVNPSTGKLDMRYNPLCLSGDTEVRVLDGSVWTVEDMAGAFDRGEEQWVWASDLNDDGRTRPAKVTWAGVTRRDAKLVKITLDNGKSVRVTPDHKMIRRNGQKVEAQDLIAGDSLMPFRRRISTKAKGESLEGYELIYCPKIKKSEYGHRLVARDLNLSVKGQVVHHGDFDPLNNSPSNLTGMWPRDHRDLHAKLGHSGGAEIARRRLEDPVLDAKLREAARKTITRYNKSEKKRSQIAGWNLSRDQGRFIRDYNESPKHAEDNEIRRRLKKEMWEDPSRRETACHRMRLAFPVAFVEGVRQLIRDNPGASMESLSHAANSVVLDEMKAANPTRSLPGIHRHLLRKMAINEGFSSFKEFKSSAIDDNHKVVSVEWLDGTEDTYTLTVEPCHTFALEAGVFVCNSPDEDIFIPVRDGKRSTEIDILQGPDYSEVESLEYHRDKLVSALKIPKAYMGYGGEATRNALSSEDIRFARTVMRIQQVVRAGYKHAMYVHQVAIGIDPNKNDFDVKMSVPSQILELSKIEVLAATSDLAGRMGEQVSSRWLLTHLYKFTEEEAAEVMKEKQVETLERGRVEAKVAKMQMSEEEGTQGASTEAEMLERRLSNVVVAVRKDWEREFDANRKSDSRLDSKLETILKHDGQTKKRLKNLSAIVLDVRSSMRQSSRD